MHVYREIAGMSTAIQTNAWAPIWFFFNAQIRFQPAADVAACRHYNQAGCNVCMVTHMNSVKCMRVS
jgi:hypothetical protein